MATAISPSLLHLVSPLFFSSVCLSVFLSVSDSASLDFYLSVCLYLSLISVSACVSVYLFRSSSLSHVHKMSWGRTTWPHGGTLTPIWEDRSLEKGVLRGASEVSYNGTASSIRMPSGNTHESMGPQREEQALQKELYGHLARGGAKEVGQT